MPDQLTLRAVSKSYADRTVLDSVDLTVAPGEHLGIVGENGSGKSTLLRLIAGVETPDEGVLNVRADGGVGHLGQTLGLPAGSTVRQVIDVALAELRAIERRMRALEADLAAGDTAAGTMAAGTMAEYGDLLHAFEARGGYEADARTEKAIGALGLGHLTHDRTLGSLSGGEAARLALACLLAAAPRLMLLDEPTNHLDGVSVTWLEERLREHRGTVVVVSHDRLFLDRVARTVVEVEEGTLTRYGGGYRGYLAERAAARRRWEQDHIRWCEEVREAEEAVATTARRVAPGRAMKDNNKMAYDRNAGRVQSSVASRVRQAEERLRRLHRDTVPKPPEPLRFTGGFGTGDASGVLVELRDVRVGERLKVPHLAVARGERLLVQGRNGAGKTTLLGVLAGVTTPDFGTVHRGGRVGYLPQETEVPDPARSLLSAFAWGRPGHPDERRERLLALGLFREDALGTPVGALSIGGRRRLALARLLTTEADLLLLDEPTNHLSPTLVEELEQALDGYSGALVVVSHDRAFGERFRGARIHLNEGTPSR